MIGQNGWDKVGIDRTGLRKTEVGEDGRGVLQVVAGDTD